ncbi:hypothetical protein J437_LFUL015206 [Ladona fulva]|uniref:Endonuclease/exonuclease/phosphatase domain-containing protein n=1 Tax=Ladona fulva TaxID=123851 RepID=A0A8K0KJR3_LADFU|nr:hypothetical protein J437_LFUL015206 [Ladona fulva]
MALRNGLGLPDHGRVQLKERVCQNEGVYTFRTGSLNVGTMTGKSREIADLMSRRRLKILCVQETRWKGNKAKELAEGYKLYYSGTKNGRYGVGIILAKELKEGVSEVDRKSDRIMPVKLEVGGGRATNICAYAPQLGCEVEEKDAFWKDLDQVVAGIPEEERVFVGADLNGHVEKRRSGEERVHGDWSVRERMQKESE